MKHVNPICSIRSIFIFLATVLAIANCPLAEENATPEIKIDTTLNADKRVQVVNAVIETMHKYYVDTAKAGEMAALLEERLEAGGYDAFTSRDPFIRELTRDLRSVTHDLHLGVWPIETSLTLSEISEEEKQKEAIRRRYENYGIPTAKRLQGNIGYLEILDFEASKQAGEAAVAAMNFLANCDALIIDLRRCGGGEGPNVPLIMSYLFEEPVHLSSAHTRYSDVTEQLWSLPFVPGPLMSEVPVYVLLSRRTASAAEAMAYGLKARDRGTLVGERTRGAAYRIDEINFPELSVCVSVSISEVTNPITGTCWEQVGIEPDIDVPAEIALQTACRLAAERLLQSDTDEDVKRRRQWALQLYEAEIHPIEMGEAALGQLCGNYSSSVSVTNTGGRLLMRRADGEPSYTLIPLGGDDDNFAVMEREARVKFNRGPDGRVAESILTLADGYNFTFKRIAD